MKILDIVSSITHSSELVLRRFSKSSNLILKTLGLLDLDMFGLRNFGSPGSPVSSISISTVLLRTWRIFRILVSSKSKDSLM